MKLKTWKLMLFSGICFSFAGITPLIRKKYFLGVIFIFLGGLYFVLSINNYKDNNKSNQIRVPDTISDNMDVELKNLIARGRKNKAIKKYRMVTGLGSREAKKYVDNLK